MFKFAFFFFSWRFPSFLTIFSKQSCGPEVVVSVPRLCFEQQGRLHTERGSWRLWKFSSAQQLQVLSATGSVEDLWDLVRWQELSSSSSCTSVLQLTYPSPLQKRMSPFCSHGFQDHRGQQTHNLLPPKPCPHNLLSSEILSRLPQRHLFLPGTGNQKISIHHLHHGGHDNVILSTFAPCNQKAKRKAFKTKLKTDVPTIALLHKKYTRYITTNQRKSTHTENHCHSQTPPPKNRTKKIQKEKEKNHR